MDQAHVNHILSGIVLFSAMLAPAVIVQTLYGGVTVNDSLQKASPKLKELSGAKYDKTAPAPKRDCVCFDRQRIEVKQIDGKWKIFDGEQWILDFNSGERNARMVADTIRSYKMNQICFVGRNTARPMMYFLSDGQAPEGKVAGEDAIPFDPRQVRAEQKNGSWKLTCGTMWMEDFGNNADAARDAAEQVKYYGFTRQCFIGRPMLNSPVSMLHKDSAQA